MTITFMKIFRLNSILYKPIQINILLKKLNYFGLSMFQLCLLWFFLIFRFGSTRWAALMIQLGKFVGGGVADTNYLYPARWGWIKYNIYLNAPFQFLYLGNKLCVL